MKKLILSVIIALGFNSGMALAESKYDNRGTVVKITATIEYPDGTTREHSMDTCTPGGLYNGVDAIIFGDNSIKVYQAGYAALYPEYGDVVSKLWNNKAEEGDPWLPTYLIVKDPNTGFDEQKEKVTSSSSVFMPKKKVRKTVKKELTNVNALSAPILMTVCGGYRHDDN
ncbi:hypothetical protein SG34_010485 [Thalassomonas viridans]|uniref:Uncharacterized protein n=1 Tax=Thalassomonas viridans TaxID=137584 RepID=A0AAF0CAV4_9GAMM|nr:hypothetical protein [Thalassomonas viridans]WDE07273.1 hypothetical protein SG34_010485 [Thalassomonas viridans]